METEQPGMTYQRFDNFAIANNAIQDEVPSLRRDEPGRNCDDQPPASATLVGVEHAPLEVANQSLLVDIERAVCNTDIKLENFLYNLFWQGLAGLLLLIVLSARRTSRKR
ncbi:hypothetical protein FOMPIDRAFT_1055109 [Fomitopsis schrenkii]|uniref:Uncharacterized protein n=1 Tax=Fomitopsis schrenkii TaxID=2126942 RepID=S8DT31_FOMSC|nr:hypothetical protein FOMPIDRAFT_1055109 [Fomitopsis schrenkii]